MEGIVNLLEEGAREQGILLNKKQVDMFIEYLELLKKWNQKMNLTAITDEKEIVIKHFLDSLTCAGTEYVTDGVNAIDIGTGAGFPGIPLKIVFPDMKFTLVDSLNKRVNFLKEVISKLELRDIYPLHIRAEDLGINEEYREGYQLCFSRAVSHLSILCEYCLPFVKLGGFFLAFKGPGYREELREAEKAIDMLGGELCDVKEFSLPGTNIFHYVLVIKKIKPTPSKYPRKAGKPEKKPIK